MDALEHELLVRIDERVQQLQKDVNRICGTNATQNGRLDKLENWQSKIIGALIILSLILTFIA